MTTTQTTSPVRPLPAITAPDSLIAEARANVAARLRDKGQIGAAEQVETTGEGWAVRHEVARLVELQGRTVGHVPV